MQPQEILNLVWQLAMTVKKQKKYFHHSAIASYMTRENLAILAQQRKGSKGISHQNESQSLGN